MSSDFPSQRPIDEIVHGEDEPLMVAKVIQHGGLGKGVRNRRIGS